MSHQEMQTRATAVAEMNEAIHQRIQDMKDHKQRVDALILEKKQSIQKMTEAAGGSPENVMAIGGAVWLHRYMKGMLEKEAEQQTPAAQDPMDLS